MKGTEHEVLLDDELIEEDFNAALSNLQKALGTGETLHKSKDEEDDEQPAKSSDAEEDEDESEEEEEEDMDYEKSMDEYLAEDPEASAAMDVEPFLRQLVKAIDETVNSVAARVRKVESLVKSQGEALVQVARLEKSTSDMVRQIGGQPVQSNSVRVLAKSRFGEGESAAEFDNMDVLVKSREWLRNGKIDLTDAGRIEGRINKGLLGKSGDPLDQKVATLMKEGN